jgi:serine/threonine protein kinase
LQGIVHADLKPENIMFSDPSPASTLKVRSCSQPLACCGTDSCRPVGCSRCPHPHLGQQHAREQQWHPSEMAMRRHRLPALLTV